MKMLVNEAGFYPLTRAVEISLQTATLAPVGSVSVHGDAAGDAFNAVSAMRPVGMAATASVSKLDKLTVQRHCHRYAWVRHKIHCHAIW